MLRRFAFWLIFAVALLVAWRLAGALVDLVLLVVLLCALLVFRYWPFKPKK